MSLASGSSGNCLVVWDDEQAVLVDCGVSMRALTSLLRVSGLDIEDLNMVFVSHEHGDHARLARNLSERGVPVATSLGTAEAIGLARNSYTRLAAGKPDQISGIEVVPLGVSHDAAEPLGVFLAFPGGSITVLTDLGCSQDSYIDPISASDLIVLEANHDEGMLRNGPYPEHLKRRVQSRTGHLSNQESADLLHAALHCSSRPHRVWLAHLSATNNSAITAVQTVVQRIGGIEVGALHRSKATDLNATDGTTKIGPGGRQLSLGI